jgi:hypothetical protein
MNIVTVKCYIGKLMGSDYSTLEVLQTYYLLLLVKMLHFILNQVKVQFTT